MKLRFIVTVQDYHVGECFARMVRKRAFRNLAAARRYEAKLYKKARRKAPQGWGKIERWGSAVHEFHVWSLTRTITITCRS